jgi:hypothetical protein
MRLNLLTAKWRVYENITNRFNPALHCNLILCSTFCLLNVQYSCLFINRNKLYNNSLDNNIKKIKREYRSTMQRQRFWSTWNDYVMKLIIVNSFPPSAIDTRYIISKTATYWNYFPTQFVYGVTLGTSDLTARIGNAFRER